MVKSKKYNCTHSPPCSCSYMETRCRKQQPLGKCQTFMTDTHLPSTSWSLFGDHRGASITWQLVLIEHLTGVTAVNGFQIVKVGTLKNSKKKEHDDNQKVMTTQPHYLLYFCKQTQSVYLFYDTKYDK